MSDKLTTKPYWESYYRRRHSDKQHIIGVCSYYDDFWNVFLGSDSKDKTIIEIGGFPGRYLAYLSSRYSLIPTCLDYNSDISQIQDAFKVMDVSEYHIIQEDFTQYEPKTTYDFVLSNGFIEHFKDFDTILDLHMKYLNANGKLYIMIPNMRGYIWLYKKLIDSNNLDVHNLKSMSLNVFKSFGNRNRLKILHLNYYGGFPYGVHQKMNTFHRLFYTLHKHFFKKIGNTILKKYPSRFFSSSIIAIFEKQ